MESVVETKGPGIGGFLSKILGTGAKEMVDSIGTAIDKIDKSDEKLEMQLKYKELLMKMEGACIDYESRLLESQSKIVETEAKGESWLQRNWRPMLMCICMFIIFTNYVLVPILQNHSCHSGRPYLVFNGNGCNWLCGRQITGKNQRELGASTL